MRECSKCGSRKIAGPRYVASTHSSPGEKLAYTCKQCGFQRFDLTLDEQMRSERMRALLARCTEGPR